MFKDTESSSSVWASIQAAVFQVLQIINLRLALLIGIAAFMLAVGFDSSGNQAEAADLVTGSSLVPVSINRATAPSNSFESQPLASDAQLATARRLHHGSLTSAIITSNRLTGAHFFIDLPSDHQ